MCVVVSSAECFPSHINRSMRGSQCAFRYILHNMHAMPRNGIYSIIYDLIASSELLALCFNIDANYFIYVFFSPFPCARELRSDVFLSGRTLNGLRGFHNQLRAYCVLQAAKPRTQPLQRRECVSVVAHENNTSARRTSNNVGASVCGYALKECRLGCTSQADEIRYFVFARNVYSYRYSMGEKLEMQNSRQYSM